jgi:hypothetical protein
MKKYFILLLLPALCVAQEDYIPEGSIQEKLTKEDLILYIGAVVFFFIIGRFVALWYYKIDDRITQQHETNRLLRKLAGEAEVESTYLNVARSKTKPTVSTKLVADGENFTNSTLR